MISQSMYSPFCFFVRQVSCAGVTGQFCRPDLVNRAVHAFRQGHPRVTLSLAGPSPLDAIIATGLQ